MDWNRLLQLFEPRMALWAMASFVGVTLLLPLLVPLAERLQFTDRPGGRKQHEAPTPFIGGVVLMLVVTACFVAFDAWLTPRLAVFMVSGAILVAVGLVDDRVGLGWRLRIAAQVAVSLLMIFVGDVHVENLADVFGVAELHLGWIGIPFTIFVVVGVINAVNMIDGSDGLAGGQVLAALLLYCAFALYAGQLVILGRLMIIAGAVAGFLVWNMRFPWQPRARVFLGNAGSMFLGFVIAWAAIRLTQNPDHPVSPVLAPWALALPLLDCVRLMFLRYFQGRSPFAADRNHLHHLLLDAGFAPAAIALALMVLALVLGLAAGFAVMFEVPRPLVVLVFLVVLVVYLLATRDHDRFVAWLHRFAPAVRSAPSRVEAVARRHLRRNRLTPIPDVDPSEP